MTLETIDPKSVRFLNAIRYLGGDANITEIRRLSGLNRNEANYRFGKLDDQDFITITYEESPGDLADRKVAKLTGTARAELERGLGSATTAGLVISDEPDSDEVSRERFREMEEELEALRESQKAAAFDQQGKDVIERDEFREFEEYVYDWHEAAEKYIFGIRNVIERFLPGVDDLSEHFEEKEEV